MQTFSCVWRFFSQSNLEPFFVKQFLSVDLYFHLFVRLSIYLSNCLIEFFPLYSFVNYLIILPLVTQSVSLDLSKPSIKSISWWNKTFYYNIYIIPTYLHIYILYICTVLPAWVLFLKIFQARKKELFKRLSVSCRRTEKWWAAAHGENCLFPAKYERFRPLYGEFIQNASAGFHNGLDIPFCQLPLILEMEEMFFETYVHTHGYFIFGTVNINSIEFNITFAEFET